SDATACRTLRLGRARRGALAVIPAAARHQRPGTEHAGDDRDAEADVGDVTHLLGAVDVLLLVRPTNLMRTVGLLRERRDARKRAGGNANAGDTDADPTHG